jgi:hypothetical protein
VTVTSSSSAAISLINISSGYITFSGAGDAPTGSSVEGQNAIISDGTNIQRPPLQRNNRRSDIRLWWN